MVALISVLIKDDDMSIRVETGKKEALTFENSKVKVVGSSGITHSGLIDLNRGQVVPASGANTQRQPSRPEVRTISEPSSPAPTPARNKVQVVSINKNALKPLKPGMKLGVTDAGFADMRLVLASEWEYKSSAFEVDLSFFLTDEDGKAKEEDFIFYNNPVDQNRAVVLDSDRKLKIAQQFDMCAEIDLNKIPPYVHSISVTATITDESRKFGELKNGKLHFLTHNSAEMLELPFTDSMTNENAIVICEFYKHKGQWKIKGVAQGFFGGLQALCENFKIETTS